MSDAGRDDAKSPFERALDLGVYAPLGFALEFRRLVPELAEAGRRQVAFSRSLGKAALSSVAKAASAKTTTAPTTTATPDVPSRTDDGPGSPSRTDDGEVSGYDGLTARDIIDMIPTLSEANRLWIAGRERAGKQRKTVLAALERATTG